MYHNQKFITYISYLHLQRRKTGTSNKPRDASNAHGATAAESVRNFVTKNKKFSRKINYSAYDTLFGGTTTMVDTGQHKDPDESDGLYHMDDDGDGKSDGEPTVIIEESGGGGVGAQKPPRKSQTRKTVHASHKEVGGRDGDGDGDTTMDVTVRMYSDDDQDAEGEKDDDTWGAADDVDPYEQEV